MPAIPDGAKKPTDRKSKDGEPDEEFSFKHKGKTYTFAPTLDGLTPGFIRRNRSSEVEFTYGLLEVLADDETLDVMDNMSLADNKRIMREFDSYATEFMKVSLGE